MFVYVRKTKPYSLNRSSMAILWTHFGGSSTIDDDIMQNSVYISKSRILNESKLIFSLSLMYRNINFLVNKSESEQVGRERGACNTKECVCVYMSRLTRWQPVGCDVITIGEDHACMQCLRNGIYMAVWHHSQLPRRININKKYKL